VVVVLAVAESIDFNRETGCGQRRRRN
jgi:hypothetical protein